VLLGAAGIALILGTTLGVPLRELRETVVGVHAPGFALELTLQRWIDDGLMTLFFLVVGLELKREILVGELSSWRDAALPVVAAAGGMAVPASIYAALNAGTPAAAGWGIPTATDIAFAVGVLVLLGDRVPRNLIVFLTALAIADDLGAVLVIAIFYSHGPDLTALAAAGGVTAVLVLLNRGGVRHALPYAAAGLALWYFMLDSGVHATLAGIVLAACVPARGAVSPRDYGERLDELRERFETDLRDCSTPEDPLRNAALARLASAMEASAVSVQSPLQRIEHRLTPWVTFAVLPLFALANAAIDLSNLDLGAMAGGRVTAGVVLGLALGKCVGIGAASALAVRLGLARLPGGVGWRHLLGAALLGGIGFTMSLFVSQLAFSDPGLVEQAKVGILLGSLASGVAGLLWLRFVAR
jgi:NhaA family Na+:H+ antiporter